ncbi:MAG: alpha/beta hydrolase [Quisquiliibacterium sp.]
MIRTLSLSLLAVAVFLAGITMLQDRLLYFPDTAPLPAVLADAKRHGLRSWPSSGEFRGLVREPEGPARATLVLLHGNAGQAGHRTDYARLARYGIRVILAEYPGYGPRPGRPSEPVLTTDAVRTIALARKEFGDPVLLGGESLGSGVAAAAYAQNPASVAGLWLITPWDTLVNVAKHHYPWLPVGWMLRDRYDSLKHLANAKAPIAVTVAENDMIVPARFGRSLYEQIRTAPKRLWVVRGAGHNDWLTQVDEQWWAEVANYLLQNHTGSRPGPIS